MSGVNKVILIGRLGKDPEIRNFDNGGMIANFSMATSEVYKDKVTQEKKEITDWHNCVVRDAKRAEVIQKYVHKGDLLYVEGKLRTRSWEKDGKTNYITEVIVDNFNFLSSKGDKQGQQQSEPSSQAQPQSSSTSTPDTSDDLPF